MPSSNDPAVIRMLREYRQALIEREVNQTERLAKSWIQIEHKLSDEMLLLARQIEDEKLKGSVITEQLLRRQARYLKLQDQMKSEILKYSRETAATDIEKEQRAYGELALRTSQDTIKMMLDFGAQFDRLPKDAIETYVGYLGDGTPLYRLLKEAYPDALDGVVSALLEGTAKGINPNQVAYNMSRSMGMGLERITLIARTEQLRVNRAVSADQYRNSGLDGVMKRVATKDDAVCLACLMSDGEEIPLDQELDDHPRGRCVAIFQINGVNEINWEKGPDWFERQSPEFQKEMMGDAKYEAWQAGKFDLKDLRQTSYSDVWGNSPRVATLEELLGGASSTAFATQPQEQQIKEWDDLVTQLSERFGTSNVTVEEGNPEGHGADVLANARGQTIQVNLEALKDYEFGPRTLRSGETYQPIAAKNEQEIIIHEYGHVINRDLLLDDKYFDYGLAKPSTLREHGLEWADQLASRLDAIAKRQGEQISDYATTNAEEYFAEAFILYNRGPKWYDKINPEVLKIFKRLDGK